MELSPSRSRLRTILLTLALLFCAFVCAANATLAYADNSKAQGISIGQTSTVNAPASSSTPPLAAGTYFIQTSLPRTYMLDVSGASKANGANVQIYTSNNTAAQKWRVTIDKQGYYSFQNLASKKYLDVSGGIARNSKNVWQYASNNTKAQKWTVTKSGNGYIIASAINKKFVLDVSGAKAADGTNVQVYQANGTTAQRWWFIPTKYSVPSAKTVVNGLYEIHFTKDEKFALDLSGASTQNGANIQLYKSNGSSAQKWFITRGSDGFYTIRNVQSSKVLDVSGANPAARTNVQQWAGNNTPAQKWAIVENKNGSYSFINAVSGMALDIAGGKANNGTNAQVYLAQRGSSQQFALKESSLIGTGVYTLYSQLAPSKQVVDVKDMSKKQNGTLQLWENGDNMAQRFQFRRVAKDTYQIQSVYSGLYLEDVNEKVVQKKRVEGSKAQQWKVTTEGSAAAFTNVATGKRLAVSGGKSANGTALITTKASNTKAQHFIPKQTNLIADGYFFVAHNSGKVLDVKGASLKNNGNIQLYGLNKSAAQKFFIASVGGGYYKLINNNSDKAVDVAGASTKEKANVQQYIFNETNAQKWKAELGIDGGFIFTNKASGKVLDVNGNASKDGTNVVQKTRAKNNSQYWNLTATSSTGISGNAELDRHIRRIVSQNNGDLAKCFAWTTKNIGFVGSVRGEELPFGIVDKQQTIRFALYAFNNKEGDCYYYASAFMWLARGCGYDAQVRAGKVAIRGGRAAHGWAEVYADGTAYICDPNLAVDIGAGRNWFMTTYENAPVYYYR